MGAEWEKTRLSFEISLSLSLSLKFFLFISFSSFSNSFSSILRNSAKESPRFRPNYCISKEKKRKKERHQHLIELLIKITLGKSVYPSLLRPGRLVSFTSETKKSEGME